MRRMPKEKTKRIKLTGEEKKSSYCCHRPFRNPMKKGNRQKSRHFGSVATHSLASAKHETLWKPNYAARACSLWRR